MKNPSLLKFRGASDRLRFVVMTSAVLGATTFLTSCREEAATRWQGYLEGEFVYVSAPLGGQLSELLVHEGDEVNPGSLLFALEQKAELAAQRRAAAQLKAVEARLEDVRKGLRPSELEALAAQVDQARSTAELARIDFERVRTLFETSVVAESEFDRTRVAHQRAVSALSQLNAELATARLGGRADLVSAAEADVRAAAAAKEVADWNVEQKTQRAPRQARVYDAMYHAGEYVAPGVPVVALLAPDLLKVRFFVPEADFATLKPGDPVRVTISSRPPITARIVYLSPQPEYTPPVLYNRENRSKLVFMVEATFSRVDAQDLHPGQPVDVGR